MVDVFNSIYQFIIGVKCGRSWAPSCDSCPNDDCGCNDDKCDCKDKQGICVNKGNTKRWNYKFYNTAQNCIKFHCSFLLENTISHS